MRYIGIIILLVLCLTLLLFTGCMINTVKPEPASGNFENQEDINQSNNNSQSSSTGPVEELVTEDTEATGTVYPQQWATGDGTAGNPWANDCIQKAHDYAPVGGIIYLKAGYYALSDDITITKKVNIIGEGRNKTIIITANAFGFNINTVNYVTLKGFTIDGDAQTKGDAEYLAPINIAHSDYIILEDIETKNSGYYGIGLYECNYSLLQNIYTHDNYRHGISGASGTAGRNKYNTYRNIYCWDNGVSGFDDRGVQDVGNIEALYNTYDNIQCWDNGDHGIALTYQSGIVLSDSVVSGNGVNGIYLKYMEDCTVSNCMVTLSNEDGILLSVGIKNVSFTNVIVKNNNFSDTDCNSGVKIQNSSGIKFISCQFYDDRNIPLQCYGIQLEETNLGINIVNCKLLPNKYGDIYDPAGVVLTVIAEKKKLSKF